MKKITFCLLFVMLTAIGASDAFAQTSRLYFAGYLALVSSGDLDFSETTTANNGDMKLKNANSFAGAMGLRFSRNLRIEAELGYRSQDVDTLDTAAGNFEFAGDITATTGLLNVIYDFDVPWKLEPFVSAGLGLALIEADLVNAGGPTPSVSDDAIELVWALGGGARYRMSPKLAFTGGYRYMDTTDLELGSYNIEYSNHEFRVGLEYDLGTGSTRSRF